MRLTVPTPPLSWDGGALRPWHDDDAPTLTAAWHDREIARWNPVPPDPSDERAAGWIAGCDQRLVDGRSLDLCIVAAETDDVVGEVGLSGFDWDRRAALIGYWLLPAGRGAGLATNATSALADWAFSELGLSVVVARCNSANLASQAVAQRAGFSHAHSDGEGHELWVRRSTNPNR